MNKFTMRPEKSTGWIFGMIMMICVFCIDQLSKYWVLNIVHLPDKGSIEVFAFFNLTMVWNKAITFGMLGQLGTLGPIIFTIMASLIALGLFVWMIRSYKWWVTLSLGAIIGGAIGNIVDRVRFGAVVDFIHLHVAGWSWYVFNIADSAIVCGVAILLADAVFQWGAKT